MKTKFIINPISGEGKQKHIERLISENLDTNLFEYEVEFTKERGSAKQICKKAISENYESIIAVGGDGTVNEISSELIGTNISLGIIPAGSGNGFAFYFGMKKNIRESIQQLNNHEIKLVDSCRANNNVFVNVSGIGFDAHIANLFSQLKKRGLLRYIRLIMQELNYQAKKYVIKYNGKEKKIDALLISFANATQYGNYFKISPNAKFDDQLIDFVIIKNMPKWRIFQLLLKISSPIKLEPIP